MQLLEEILSQVPAAGVLYQRSAWPAPFGMRFEGRCQASFHLVSQGRAWLRVDDEAPLALAAGDLVMLPHGTPHEIADAPSTPARPFDPGAPPATTGPGQPAAATLICGAYLTGAQGADPAHHPVLQKLPPVLHLPAQMIAADGVLAALVAALQAELKALQPSQLVCDRLLDAMLLAIVRSWLHSACPHAARCNWLTALRDPAMAEVLDTIHRHPERSWTVATLARLAGMSRATFARRFRERLGAPPLRYLTRARLDQAARLLRDTDMGLEQIAVQVGYADASSLSRAFQRELGQAPGAYRDAG